MTNAFLNMTMTTNVTKAIRRAKAVLRLPSISTGAAFMGSTDDDAFDELASCVNDALTEFVSDFPILGVVTETLTTTAGSNKTEIPETLMNAQIVGMQWAYDGRVGEAIAMLDAANVLSLPAWLKNEETVSDPPDYVYLEWPQDGGKGHFVWIPGAGAARDFKVSYQASSVTVTSDNVQGIGAAVIVPVPDAMMEVFAHCLAYRIGERDTGANSVEPSVVRAKYMALVDDWTGRLSSTPYQTQYGTSGFSGMPSDAGGSRFRDVMRPRFLR